MVFVGCLRHIIFNSSAILNASDSSTVKLTYQSDIDLQPPQALDLKKILLLYSYSCEYTYIYEN